MRVYGAIMAKITGEGWWRCRTGMANATGIPTNPGVALPAYGLAGGVTPPAEPGEKKHERVSRVTRQATAGRYAWMQRVQDCQGYVYH